MKKLMLFVLLGLVGLAAGRDDTPTPMPRDLWVYGTVGLSDEPSPFEPAPAPTVANCAVAWDSEVQMTSTSGNQLTSKRAELVSWPTLPECVGIEQLHSFPNPFAGHNLIPATRVICVEPVALTDKQNPMIVQVRWLCFEG